MSNRAKERLIWGTCVLVVCFVIMMMIPPGAKAQTPIQEAAKVLCSAKSIGLSIAQAGVARVRHQEMIEKEWDKSWFAERRREFLLSEQSFMIANKAYEDLIMKCAILEATRGGRSL